MPVSVKLRNLQPADFHGGFTDVGNNILFQLPGCHHMVPVEICFSL